MTEMEKGKTELKVFHDFVKKSWLPIRLETIEKRQPPEPDIRCEHETDGLLSFELVEICDFRIASIKPSHDAFLRTEDPTLAIIQKKLRKTYKTDYPIDLLCYNAGRTVSPDEVVVSAIESCILSEGNYKMFRRIWYSGDTVHLIKQGLLTY